MQQRAPAKPLRQKVESASQDSTNTTSDQVEKKEHPVIQAIKDMGVDCKQEPKDVRELLQMAVDRTYQSYGKYDANFRDKKGETLLAHAVRHLNIPAVKWLLEQKVQITEEIIGIAVEPRLQNKAMTPAHRDMLQLLILANFTKPALDKKYNGIRLCNIAIDEGLSEVIIKLFENFEHYSLREKDAAKFTSLTYLLRAFVNNKINEFSILRILDKCHPLVMYHYRLLQGKDVAFIIDSGNIKVFQKLIFSYQPNVSIYWTRDLTKGPKGGLPPVDQAIKNKDWNMLHAIANVLGNHLSILNRVASLGYIDPVKMFISAGIKYDLKSKDKSPLNFKESKDRFSVDKDGRTRVKNFIEILEKINERNWDETKKYYALMPQADQQDLIPTLQQLRREQDAGWLSRLIHQFNSTSPPEQKQGQPLSSEPSEKKEGNHLEKDNSYTYLSRIKTMGSDCKLTEAEVVQELDAVRAIAKFDPNYKDYSGATALMHAVNFGNIAAVKWILEHKVTNQVTEDVIRIALQPFLEQKQLTPNQHKILNLLINHAYWHDQKTEAAKLEFFTKTYGKIHLFNICFAEGANFIDAFISQQENNSKKKLPNCLELMRDADSKGRTSLTYLLMAVANRRLMIPQQFGISNLGKYLSILNVKPSWQDLCIINEIGDPFDVEGFFRNDSKNLNVPNVRSGCSLTECALVEGKWFVAIPLAKMQLNDVIKSYSPLLNKMVALGQIDAVKRLLALGAICILEDSAYSTLKCLNASFTDVYPRFSDEYYPFNQAGRQRIQHYLHALLALKDRNRLSLQGACYDMPFEDYESLIELLKQRNQLEERGWVEEAYEKRKGKQSEIADGDVKSIQASPKDMPPAQVPWKENDEAESKAILAAALKKQNIESEQKPVVNSVVDPVRQSEPSVPEHLPQPVANAPEAPNKILLPTPPSAPDDFQQSQPLHPEGVFHAPASDPEGLPHSASLDVLMDSDDDVELQHVLVDQFANVEKPDDKKYEVEIKSRQSDSKAKAQALSYDPALTAYSIFPQKSAPVSVAPAGFSQGDSKSVLPPDTRDMRAEGEPEQPVQKEAKWPVMFSSRSKGSENETDLPLSAREPGLVISQEIQLEDMQDKLNFFDGLAVTLKHPVGWEDNKHLQLETALFVLEGYRKIIDSLFCNKKEDMPKSSWPKP